MSNLAVLGSGLVTALGYNAPATLAALRAGVCGVEATPWMDFESGEPLRGARVSLPQWSVDIDKLADLVAPAIHECMLQASDVSPREIPVMIGVAHRNRPHRVPRLEESLLNEVQTRLEVPLHRYSALFPHDETGCIQALLAARELIARQPSTLVIVAGVDSFLHQEVLDDYMARRRIMTRSNSNGFFPGEGGSAVLLGAAGHWKRDELCIVGIGTAQEDATIDSTRPLRARGLTDAMKRALHEAGATFKDASWRITDLTGEHYKFKEAAFAAGRLDTASRDGPPVLWHPIEYLGALGAAVLPCLLAQALHAGLHGYAPAPLALCHIGSDDGQRAALVAGLRRQGKSSP